MPLFDLLILALATFYVAYVVTLTEGPSGIFARLRNRFPAGGLTTCIYCLAFWVGLIFYVLLLTPTAWLVYPFSVAGAAMLLFRFSGGQHV